MSDNHPVLPASAVYGMINMLKSGVLYSFGRGDLSETGRINKNA
jgi:hypothetical protein